MITFLGRVKIMRDLMEVRRILVKKAAEKTILRCRMYF
jgi:hypothetical protein